MPYFPASQPGGVAIYNPAALSQVSPPSTFPTARRGPCQEHGTKTRSINYPGWKGHTQQHGPAAKLHAQASTESPHLRTEWRCPHLPVFWPHENMLEVQRVGPSHDPQRQKCQPAPVHVCNRRVCRGCVRAGGGVCAGGVRAGVCVCARGVCRGVCARYVPGAAPRATPCIPMNHPSVSTIRNKLPAPY